MKDGNGEGFGECVVTPVNGNEPSAVGTTAPCCKVEATASAVTRHSTPSPPSANTSSPRVLSETVPLMSAPEAKFLSTTTQNVGMLACRVLQCELVAWNTSAPKERATRMMAVGKGLNIENASVDVANELAVENDLLLRVKVVSRGSGLEGET